MKFSVSAAVAGLAAISTAAAYKVSSGSVSSKNVELAKLKAGSSQVPSIPIESHKDSFLVSVNFEKASKPAQLLFMLSNNENLDYSVYARFVDSESKATASIVVSDIPAALKVQDQIFVSVVAANGNDGEENIIVPLFSFVPAGLFKSSIEYKAPARLGALPEIHHNFRGEQTTVGFLFPVFFSAGAFGLLLALVGAWIILLKEDMFSGTLSAVYKIGYIASLGCFEFVVLRYYLGTSIFTTLRHTALVAVPMSFLGSRALTSLAKRRISS